MAVELWRWQVYHALLRTGALSRYRFFPIDDPRCTALLAGSLFIVYTRYTVFAVRSEVLARSDGSFYQYSSAPEYMPMAVVSLRGSASPSR